LIVGFLLYGLYMAATEGVGKALVVSLVPGHLKGTALGIFGLVVGFSSLFASLIAGWMWDHISPASVFYYGAGGALLAAMVFFTLGTSLEKR
jgi:MFS family permease